jgi:hypothetical protein
MSKQQHPEAHGGDNHHGAHHGSCAGPPRRLASATHPADQRTPPGGCPSCMATATPESKESMFDLASVVTLRPPLTPSSGDRGHACCHATSSPNRRRSAATAGYGRARHWVRTMGARGRMAAAPTRLRLTPETFSAQRGDLRTAVRVTPSDFLARNGGAAVDGQGHGDDRRRRGSARGAAARPAPPARLRAAASTFARTAGSTWSGPRRHRLQANLPPPRHRRAGW